MKLYGAHVHLKGISVLNGEPFEKEYDMWFSRDKETAQRFMEAAMAIEPPQGGTATMTLIDSEVIMRLTGRYKLENGNTVAIHAMNGSGTIMYGHPIINGRERLHAHVAYYINGVPAQSGSKAPRVVSFVPTK